MPRPPLPVGTYGKIMFLPHGDGQVQARCKFRDYDGRTRLVSRVGKSNAAAQRALTKALVERQRTAGDDLNSNTRLNTLATAWLAAGTTWSDGTRETYTYTVERYVRSALGELRVGEADVPALDRALRAIRERSGPSAAKTTKSVLSGMLGLAIRHGAHRGPNPLRDVSPIPIQQNRPRALTPSEVLDIAAAGRSNQWAIEHDLPDFIDWMLATGARIGEVCAAREGLNVDGEQLLDLEHNTWEVNATVKRLRGRGLILQQRTKSEAGWRVLALPSFAVDMAKRRQSELRIGGPAGVLFPAPLARSLRDPANTPGDLRTFLDSIDCEQCDGTGWLVVLDRKDNPLLDERGRTVYKRCTAGRFSWVTSHTFRKTVATRLEEAGCTPREVADQMGHSDPSLTLRVYFGRNVVSEKAAAVLDR